MEVYANIRQKVHIDVKTIIENLIEKELGNRNYIFEKDGKFYLSSEVSAGCHSFSIEDSIPKEKYEYIRSLQLILIYLKNTNNAG